MEKNFIWRDLLANSSDFVESKKSLVGELLETDPLDIGLENKLNAVLEDEGVEIWGPDYDKAIAKLQERYLVMRGEGVKNFSSSDFSQPCGDSHISSAFTCRIGASGLSFPKASDTQRDKLEKDYASFEESISSYNPESQKVWKDIVKSSIDELNSDSQRTDLSDDVVVGYYKRVIANATIMAEDGPPTKIFNKEGVEVPMSDKIQPALSRVGNMGWVDPVMGMSYTKRSAGQMELEQNRPSLTENVIDGRVQASVKFYDRYTKDPGLQAKGPFGSPSMAKQREVTQAEIDQRWAKLSKTEKDLVSFSGVDSVGNRRLPGGGIDQRSEHRAFYERNPDLLEMRGKEVLAAYLQQTPGPDQPARSGFTNEVIPLPGTFGPGGKAVVDHYTPLSTGYPAQRTQPWSREDGMSVLLGRDTRTNMVIVEGGLNTSKGDKENWGSGDKPIIPGWRTAERDYKKELTKVDKMPGFTTGARGPAQGSPRALAEKARVDRLAAKAERKKQRAAQEKVREDRKIERPQKKKAREAEAAKKAEERRIRQAQRASRTPTRSTRSTTPKAKATGPENNRTKPTPAKINAAIAQQKDALQQAKRDKRSGDVKALETTIKMLEAALRSNT